MHLISISLFSRKYHIPLSSTECIIYALDKMARACKDRNNQPTTLETKQQIRASTTKLSRKKRGNQIINNSRRIAQLA